MNEFILFLFFLSILIFGILLFKQLGMKIAEMIESHLHYDIVKSRFSKDFIDIFIIIYIFIGMFFVFSYVLLVAYKCL